MTHRKIRIAAIFIFILTVGYLTGMSLTAGHEDAQAEPATSNADKPDKQLTMAPDFILPSLSGKQVSLYEFRGKWVFMNFWATWCGPCVIEMPSMQRLNNALKNKNFKMLAINMENASLKTVHKFVKRLKLDFTILLDKDSAVGKLYGVRVLPMTYIINPKGEVEAASEGMRDWDDPKMVKFFHDLMDGSLKKQEKAGQTPVKPNDRPLL